MSTVINHSLVQFRDFLNEKLAEPSDATTPVEALEQFLSMQLSPEELEESLEAIRESMEEIRSGSPGISASDYFAEARKRLGMD